MSLDSLIIRDQMAALEEIERDLVIIEEHEIIRLESRLCSESFAEFVKAAWKVLEPGRPLKWNWHHDLLCREIEAFFVRYRDNPDPELAKLSFQRGIFNVPPRHTKSTLVSVCAPAWVWTWKPNHQFLCLSNSDDLAVRDAVKARRLMESAWYTSRFRAQHWPHAWEFTTDQNVKSSYENDKGGARLSQGISAKVTGKGGDDILIDDPHDAKDVMSDKTRQQPIEDYKNAVESRLNNQTTGGILAIMQRLHHMDWCGFVLKRDGALSKDRKTGTWRVVCFPQEYEPAHPHVFEHDPRKKFGELLWPDGVPQSVVDRQKRTWTRLVYSGQAQQRPTPDAGGIFPAVQWNEWDVKLMGPIPSCEYIIDSWDTAFSEEAEKKASRSALSRWGVFWHEKKGRHAIMLLYSWADHVDYPTLRKKAREEYIKHKADTVLIEKKASGQSLLQDLRAAGVPAVGYNPDRDKIARAHAVSALLEAGLVYYPSGRKWAEDHIEECAAFPRGEYSDLVDTTTQAWLRIRNSWRVEHPGNPEPQHPDDEERDDAELEEAVPFYG